MKRAICLISLNMIISLISVNGRCNVIESKSSISNIMSRIVGQLPEGRKGSYDHVLSFGLKYRALPLYGEFIGILSNDFQLTSKLLLEYPKRDIRRLLILSSGWGYDDDYFLECLSNNLELVEAKIVTQDEVRWYLEGSRDERRMNLLALNYNSPGVSNIVLRYASVIGDTNFCQRVLSGDAKCSYEEYASEISNIQNVISQ